MSEAVFANRLPRAIFLMYHSVATEGPTFLSIPPETFERQLALLRREGYVSGTLADLDELRRGTRLGAPRVFLTFDDGYADNHATAKPLLEAYGFRSLVFVIPPIVDVAGAFTWPGVAQDQATYPDTMRSMDWAMVEEMVADGHEIGSHTLTHAALDRIVAQQLDEELHDARRRLEARLGGCVSVAYPFGYWNPRVIAASKRAGYRYGFAVSPIGWRSSSALLIPRVPIDYRDDEGRFKRKLSVPARLWQLSRTRDAARDAARWVRGRRAG